MKTLANCNAVDFLTQTNKIRKAVAKWLADTEILEIRKNVPPYPEIADDVSAEEKAEIMAEFNERVQEQSKENFMAMIDSALGEHPQETTELLGLICFVEPEDVAKMKGIELVNEGMNALLDEEVLRFFTSLVKAEQTVTSVL